MLRLQWGRWGWQRNWAGKANKSRGHGALRGERHGPSPGKHRERATYALSFPSKYLLGAQGGCEFTGFKVHQKGQPCELQRMDGCGVRRAKLQPCHSPALQDLG